VTPNPIHLWIQHRTHLQAILEDIESGRLMLKQQATEYKNKVREGIALWDKLIDLSYSERPLSKPGINDR